MATERVRPFVPPPQDWVKCPLCDGNGIYESPVSGGGNDAYGPGWGYETRSCGRCHSLGMEPGPALSSWLKVHPDWKICCRSGRCRYCKETPYLISPDQQHLKQTLKREYKDSFEAWRASFAAAETRLKASKRRVEKIVWCTAAIPIVVALAIKAWWTAILIACLAEAVSAIVKTKVIVPRYPLPAQPPSFSDYVLDVIDDIAHL